MSDQPPTILDHQRERHLRQQRCHEGEWTRQDLVRLLAVNAYNVYSTCLVANPAPNVAALCETLRNPRVGDLVLETTTFGRSVVPVIGILEELASSKQSGHIYVITTLDGVQQRWANARFIRVLTDWWF